MTSVNLDYDASGHQVDKHNGDQDGGSTFPTRSIPGRNIPHAQQEPPGGDWRFLLLGNLTFFVVKDTV